MGFPVSRSLIKLTNVRTIPPGADCKIDIRCSTKRRAGPGTNATPLGTSIPFGSTRAAMHSGRGGRFHPDDYGPADEVTGNERSPTSQVYLQARRVHVNPIPIISTALARAFAIWFCPRPRLEGYHREWDSILAITVGMLA